MRAPLTALCLALGFCGSASAQEVISAGPRAAPPATEAPGPLTPKEDEAARWAQDILDHAKSGAAGKRAPDPACERGPDAKPYREVRLAVGAGGYREVGGAAVYPTANCGFVAVDLNLSEGGRGYRRHR